MFNWIDDLISDSAFFGTLFEFIPAPMRTVLLSAISLIIVWFCVKLIIDLLVSLK